MEITVKLFHGAACLLIIHRNRPVGVTKRIAYRHHRQRDNCYEIYFNVIKTQCLL